MSEFLVESQIAGAVCEQAYSMAQNLDPNSDGRGVLRFKTGLMSVIKQKLAKNDGARIDRNRDAERLWDFYQKYKRRHRVDDIQREEQRYRESGTFSANLGEYVSTTYLCHEFNIINLNGNGLNLLNSNFMKIWRSVVELVIVYLYPIFIG